MTNDRHATFAARKTEIINQLKKLRLRSLLSAGASAGPYQRTQLDREKDSLYKELAAINKILEAQEKATTR